MKTALQAFDLPVRVPQTLQLSVNQRLALVADRLKALDGAALYCPANKGLILPSLGTCGTVSVLQITPAGLSSLLASCYGWAAAGHVGV